MKDALIRTVVPIKSRLESSCGVPGLFKGAIGVIPYSLFRPMRIKIERATDVWFKAGDHPWTECDGHSYAVEGSLTWAIGDAMIIRIQNKGRELKNLRLVIHGTGTHTVVSSQVIRGMFL